MNQQPPSSGLKLGDIYYIVFRHKWKIALISMLGVAGAIAVYFLWPRTYLSSASLLIHYVQDTKTPTGEPDPSIRTPDQRGESIMNTELEIIGSWDLAQRVADTIGPNRILAPLGGGSNRVTAANVVHERLQKSVPRNSTAIRIAFEHPDPTVAQSVLSEVITNYLNMHAATHKVGAFDEYLEQATTERRNRLLQTEAELAAAKTNAGIPSITDARRAYAEELSRIRLALSEAETELAERQTVVSNFTALMQRPVQSATNTALVVPAPVPAEKISDYERIKGRLDRLMERDQELRGIYKPENMEVRINEELIRQAQKEKSDLEEAFPGLLELRAPESRQTVTAPAASPVDIPSELVRIAALQSRIQVLKIQRDNVQRDSMELAKLEATISDLERKRQFEEDHYQNYARALAEARDERLSAGRVSNITVIQHPSPPGLAPSKMLKVMAMVLFGSCGGAVALAFLIELYLDQTVRRPRELETRIPLPLFISIPLVNNGVKKMLMARNQALLAEHNEHSGNGNSDVAVAEIAPGDPRHILRPFADALRDRLITYFEVKNLTHTPKLVAVTSCEDGAGVSTIAASLAGSLSETGHGNVLLVDMKEHGASHQFRGGTITCGLDDALISETRENALVSENLYVVREGRASDQLPRALPVRFKHLTPKLRASDFDYIIFDMPPMDQLSITPRLARFMDMLLVVAEAEKTGMDTLKQATEQFADSQVNVALVLNKTRNYVPRMLKSRA